MDFHYLKMVTKLNMEFFVPENITAAFPLKRTNQYHQLFIETVESGLCPLFLHRRYKEVPTSGLRKMLMINSNIYIYIYIYMFH